MLTQLRQEAVEKLAHLPNPRSRFGLGIFSTSFELPLEVTGGFDYDIQSPSDVNVYYGSSLIQAPQELLDLVNTVAPINTQADAFHYSQLNDLVIVHIPQGVIVKQPIMLSTNLATPSHVQHILVVADQGSKAIIIDHQSSDNKEIFSSHVVEILAKEGSHIQYGSVQFLQDTVTQLSRKNATLHKDSTVIWTDCQLRSGFSRVRRHMEIKGSGAKGEFHTCSLGIGDQELDLKSTISHSEPYSKSRIVTRTALADSSKTIHRANIMIPAGVHGCDGHQQESTLLLDKKARINAVPMLEIGTDDVVCSHGSSISSLNDDQLFYFMSRGVSKSEARILLVQGFFSTVIDTLDFPTRNFVQSLIDTQIQKMGLKNTRGDLDE